MNKFRVGDVVNFKVFNRNARYFRKGHKNLEIYGIQDNGRSLVVWESDKSTTWLVAPEELELAIRRKKGATYKGELIELFKTSIKTDDEEEYND